MKNKTTDEKEKDRRRGQYHLQCLIRAAAQALLQENAHTATGSEAMTEEERAREVMRRYGSKNQTTIKKKP